MKVKIKICGMTRTADIKAAIDAGVDAIGFVFVPESPRCIDTKKALKLAKLIPVEVELVGLFMDSPAATIHQHCQQIPLTALQFHGAEDNEFCCQFGRPWVKTIAMGGARVGGFEFASWPDAYALLLDGHRAGEQGGQGLAYDWSMTPEISQKIILAGGLNSDNVSAAIQQVKPWAVDVSSGIEISPGCKDIRLIERFCNAVKASHD
ncbi:MAG: phosphoribosylanthranilate isomerase [Xanthomonadales bacterium]|nr:phosphoribosylanthranilate isomerase [Xanthomonadales bacterium]